MRKRPKTPPRTKNAYTLLESEPEKAYNWQLATKNKSEVLKNVWRRLEDNFGYRDQDPLVDITEKKKHAPVESTSKGLRIVLGDLGYCQDSVGTAL